MIGEEKDRMEGKPRRLRDEDANLIEVSLFFGRGFENKINISWGDRL